MFRKYQHIERHGTDEVEGIEKGIVYVFPKIDGTNGSIWMGEDGEVQCGSRNRMLSAQEDNHGFHQYVMNNDKYRNLLKYFPQMYLFGEWLVPHSLRTYRTVAWNKFYVFDVAELTPNGLVYFKYDDYKPMLEHEKIEYIPCIVKVEDGALKQFEKILQTNTYLIHDGEGVGEGIVLKNYEYLNKYGRQTWAKMVTSEFKEKNLKAFGTPTTKGETILEEKIIEKYCTFAFMDKTISQIVAQEGCWKSEYIKILLSRLYHDFVNEEIWSVVKEFKNPKIDFGMVARALTLKIKKYREDLF